MEEINKSWSNGVINNGAMEHTTKTNGGMEEIMYI
jgi:hypothetical protein